MVKKKGGIADPRLKIVLLSGRKIGVLGTIKGLVSERKKVREAFDSIRPTAIAVHIGKEELAGLEAVLDGEIDSAPLSSYERVYARKLAVFGEIQIPPPSLVEALRLAKENDIECLPLDFNDEAYSTQYTKTINGITMVRQSLRLKRVNRKKYPRDDPLEFILKWDRTVNRLRGFSRLEEKRERYISRKIIIASRKFDPLLCVVELERMSGILTLIEKG